MLFVVMVEQHSPDRTAISLVKQAKNVPPPARVARNTKRKSRVLDKYQAERHSFCRIDEKYAINVR